MTLKDTGEYIKGISALCFLLQNFLHYDEWIEFSLKKWVETFIAE